MYTIYVLLLEGNKYYIGRTKNYRNRIGSHFSPQGKCPWLQLHKPIRVVERVFNCDAFDEDKYTKRYMNRYGVDNVRGGAYVQLEIPQYQLQALEKELRNANDRCFRCGGNHYIKDCDVEEVEEDEEEVEEKVEEGTVEEEVEEDAEEVEEGTVVEEEEVCQICEREDHKVSECPSIDKCKCSRCGSNEHSRYTCISTVDVNNYLLTDSNYLGRIGSTLVNDFGIFR